nr:hypothetical protein [Tanacetum cinerariifolium]
MKKKKREDKEIRPFLKSGHKSEVCGLKWSCDNCQLASGENDNKLATLTGHTDRVVHLPISPDGQTIVTGAGHGILRFWNVNLRFYQIDLSSSFLYKLLFQGNCE